MYKNLYFIVRKLLCTYLSSCCAIYLVFIAVELYLKLLQNGYEDFVTTKKQIAKINIEFF